MIIQYGGASHRGKVRKSNEDYFYIPINGDIENVAMIADGMGGHNAGEIASRMAVETVMEYLAQHMKQGGYSASPGDLVRESFMKSNNKIFKCAESDEALQGMGTTLVLSYFEGDTVHIGHIGDSRGYLVRNGTVIQVTKDHSLVQELLDNGTITLEEVENHPQRNIITRALGTDLTTDIDYYRLSIEDGDIIILCTDGLVIHVDLQQNIDLIQSGITMQELSNALVSLAVEQGGLDNITVVAIKCSAAVKEG
ncbi:MAG: Stp1/IreP family PP2C-type Ser/Thr phosphatase [Clostridiales bacterium]|nr:Stp1/IreP family PP2C-type Ser/Thr phosphatase [Clostridiales bacterium]